MITIPLTMTKHSQSYFQTESRPEYFQLYLTPTNIQPFVFGETRFNIVKPEVGSILTRVNKKTGESRTYVVIRIQTRGKGYNKGAVDTAILELAAGFDFTSNINSQLPLVNPYNYIVYYRLSNHPLILSLTNHGKWWSNQLANEFIFRWDVNGLNDSPTKTERELEASASIPKRQKNSESQQTLLFNPAPNNNTETGAILRPATPNIEIITQYPILQPILYPTDSLV